MQRCGGVDGTVSPATKRIETVHSRCAFERGVVKGFVSVLYFILLPYTVELQLFEAIDTFHTHPHTQVCECVCSVCSVCVCSVSVCARARAFTCNAGLAVWLRVVRIACSRCHCHRRFPLEACQRRCSLHLNFVQRREWGLMSSDVRLTCSGQVVYSAFEVRVGK